MVICGIKSKSVQKIKTDERERERRDQSNEGNESVSSAETVEDAVLPLGGFVDLVPPIGDRHGR